MKKTAIFHCPTRIRTLLGVPSPTAKLDAQATHKTTSLATFKAKLRQQGKTIRQWAEEQGFQPSAVYRTLNGVEKGNFGQSHAILVAAGIKRAANEPIAA